MAHGFRGFWSTLVGGVWKMCQAHGVEAEGRGLSSQAEQGKTLEPVAGATPPGCPLLVITPASLPLLPRSPVTFQTSMSGEPGIQCLSLRHFRNGRQAASKPK